MGKDSVFTNDKSMALNNYNLFNVIRKEKNLLPTDNGIVVNDLLVNHFPQVVDVDFTSKMEEGLDEVAAGEEDWRKLIGDFYWPFEKLVLAKKKEIKKECKVCCYIPWRRLYENLWHN